MGPEDILEVNSVDEEIPAVEEAATEAEAAYTSYDNTSKQEEEVEEEATEDPEVYLSHFRNAEAHPVWLRYGIPLFLLGTLVLLINADVGSGVSADSVLIRDGKIIETRVLLAVSVFSSVKELWLNGSYPLAILIAVTSIAWPYVKILISFYAWLVPYRVPRKREFVIEIIDALGKWSFVDIMVLVEIMVAFRYEKESLACRVDRFNWEDVVVAAVSHITLSLCFTFCRSSLKLAPEGKLSMTRPALNN
jgi:hypothetical protein